jgi:transposase
VLACAEGLDNKTVARKLRTSLGMVGKWRSRFLEARLEGLYDATRGPRKVSDAPVEKSSSRPWKARRAAKRMGAREA